MEESAISTKIFVGVEVTFVTRGPKHGMEIPEYHEAALKISGTDKATSSNTTIDSPPNPEAREVMEWLPTLNYKGKQRKCRETRVPGSDHQILHQEFERWIDDSCSSRGRYLCCSGPPGAGKTILS